MGSTILCGRWWLASLAAVIGIATTAQAIYLDQDQNIALRARVYSQASIRTENSDQDTFPVTEDGDLVSQRNFYNPEIDAKLTSYVSGLKDTAFSFLAPDELSVRLAAWGFYDGFYDYGSPQFNRARRTINSTVGDVVSRPRRAWFLEGPNVPIGSPSGATIRTASSLDELFPGHEVQNMRDIYAHRQRVNELYLNYAKGPLFVRIGRQAISWGDSDTIALLDQNNPFDVTLGAPGIFQDLDEARIPLWTLRTSMNLFDTLGPFSSGFVEAYWVPGDIDTESGILPVLGASPYSVRGDDPNRNRALNTITGGNPPQFILIDHRPKKQMENSRWGVRLQTVVNDAVTVQTWVYTHFPNAPVPVKQNLIAFAPEGPSGPRTNLFIVETVHKLTMTIGTSASFYSESLDGIVRLQGSFFKDEPSFVPERNLSIGPGRDLLRGQGELPRANYFRWETGFDKFFFVRPLNPSNSFLLVTAIVGSYNIDETSAKDFRYSGQQKPGTAGSDPNDFVQLEKVEVFGQAHLQTDYMHGRLTPGITVIGNVRGTYAVNPTLTYRLYDWLLFDLNLVHIGGQFQQLGFFKDRDQITGRVTYQIN